LTVLQIKTKMVSCLTAYSKPVKQEVNGTVILAPLVFPLLALLDRFNWLFVLVFDTKARLESIERGPRANPQIWAMANRQQS